jgi:hypothetical protein
MAAKSIKPKLTIHRVLDSIKDEILTSVRRVMVEHDVRRKSDLYKSIEIKPKYNNIELYAADYYAYVGAVQTRKKFEKKVPISALINWIRKYGYIKSGRGKNSVLKLAFRLQNSIYKAGIRGKNFSVEVGEVTEKIMKERLEEVFSDIVIQDFAEFDPDK